MIDEKKIEEAAFKFAYNYGDISGRYSKSNVIAAFKAGINWFLDNLWHDASEEPKGDGRIFVEKICNGEKRHTDDSRKTLYSSWQYKVSRENIIRWFYVEDLLKGEK